MSDAKEFSAELAIAETRNWLEQWVVAHNLCPFAAKPVEQGRVRIVADPADEPDAMIAILQQEIERLLQDQDAKVETTLVVLPRAAADFLDFNDFMEVVDALLDALECVGDLQVVGFHPGYTFADSDVDNPANWTNRSPYPMFHLLRVASVKALFEAHEDIDSIPARNVEYLRELDEAAKIAAFDRAGCPHHLGKTVQ